MIGVKILLSLKILSIWSFSFLIEWLLNYIDKYYIYICKYLFVIIGILISLLIILITLYYLETYTTAARRGMHEEFQLNNNDYEIAYMDQRPYYLHLEYNDSRIDNQWTMVCNIYLRSLLNCANKYRYSA